MPKFLLNLEQIETLTREIGRKAADVPEPDEEAIELSDDRLIWTRFGVCSNSRSSCRLPNPLAKLPRKSCLGVRRWEPGRGGHPPQQQRVRGAVGGAGLALGLFQAKFKAFVGDGGCWLWTIWDGHFKPFDFVPIFDIIHAVTYLYAAAMAGRTAKEGGPVYRRWITWVWQGEVARAIAEVAQATGTRSAPSRRGETSPRKSCMAR